MYGWKVTLVSLVISSFASADCLDLRGQADSLQRRQQELSESAERVGRESNRLEQRSAAKEERMSYLRDVVEQAKQIKERLDDTNLQIKRYCRKN